MTLSALCDRIELQPEMRARVGAFSASFDASSVSALLEALTDSARSKDAYEALRDRLGDDPDGAKILTCYLLAAVRTHALYLERGIDERIFFDTVGCFPRFIGECLERKGILAFDRAHWAYRHLNMTLLRVGALEYERKERAGMRVNAVHIPSDADLSPAALDASFAAVRRLLRTHFPDYADAPITCESWLMGRSLHEVLGDGSKILQFQSRFDVREHHPENDAYLTFLFGRADCTDYASLPERTSLQRNVKARLLSGRGIDGGFGILKE
ncbi:MAG: DUF5596 domain-containing protein [Clostridia bacterium]|nr:DUF5596 domain-containing protein [Clostridia bacterium]